MQGLSKRGRENVMFLRDAAHPSERFMAANLHRSQSLLIPGVRQKNQGGSTGFLK
jgi:hypothetical protein